MRRRTGFGVMRACLGRLGLLDRLGLAGGPGAPREIAVMIALRDGVLFGSRFNRSFEASIR